VLCETCDFITLFTTACYWSPSRDREIQSSSVVYLLRSILILPSHLRPLGFEKCITKSESEMDTFTLQRKWCNSFSYANCLHKYKQRTQQSFIFSSQFLTPLHRSSVSSCLLHSGVSLLSRRYQLSQSTNNNQFAPTDHKWS